MIGHIFNFAENIPIYRKGGNYIVMTAYKMVSVREDIFLYTLKKE